MKRSMLLRLVTLLLVGGILCITILACASPAAVQKNAASTTQIAQPATSQTAMAAEGNYNLKPISTLNGIQTVAMEIPVSDGKKLAADLYIPEKGGPFPVILIQTPYNKDLYRPVFPYELPGKFLPEGTATTLLGAAGGSGSFIHSMDYAVVAVDWRGRFGSKSAGGLAIGGGAAEQRRQDGYDTVEWVAKQQWCNGKVGTWGSSALGQIQWETAAKQPPHLICMMPRVSDYAQNYSKYYFGGVVRKEYMDGLTAASWGALANIVMAHPTNDGFYDGKDTADPKEIKTPALIIGGWWDIHDTPKIYNAVLSTAGSEVAKNIRMLICPNSHSMIARDGTEGELDYSNAGAYVREQQKKYFDFWLRGVDNGYTPAAPVTYYQMGSNEWRTATQWPPERMKETGYYLNDGGTLSVTATQGGAPRQFSFNPNSPVPTDGGNTFNPGIAKGPIDQNKIVERHRDVLIFTSEVLSEDVAIAGDISAVLYVSSDAVDTDVAIRVTDVYPDGRSMLVRDGIQRLSHMEGDKEEKFITPGTVYPVTVKTYSVGQTFVKGHRIRLIVSASNYPRYGVNNGSEDRGKAPIKINNTLYFDAQHPSKLVLPVLPK